MMRVPGDDTASALSNSRSLRGDTASALTLRGCRILASLLSAEIVIYLKSRSQRCTANLLTLGASGAEKLLMTLECDLVLVERICQPPMLRG